MRYEMMLAETLRKAIKENWPLVLPVGVMEYHGEHMALGTDTLLVIRALEILEKDMNIVLFPPFYWGAASYAVEPPENNGTVQIDPSAIHSLARELFKSLIRIGFRNIHLFVHHQSENFDAGMPTDLACKLAARQVIFEYLEKERGEGWWGNESMRDFYSQHEKGTDPFHWIKVHPFLDAETQKKFPIDHAGLQETSLMLAFCPEGVDMQKISDQKWYCRQATQANPEYGNAAKEMILSKMRTALGQKQ